MVGRKKKEEEEEEEGFLGKVYLSLE